MRNIKDSLGQIIDNLSLIKNIETDFSQIDKDILLQNIREAYLMVLQMPVVEDIQSVETQEEVQEMVQDPVSSVEIVENEAEPVEEESVSSEFSGETVETKAEAQIQQEEEEEMDTDILEFITEVPKARVEPEIKFEEKREEVKIKEKPDEVKIEEKPKEVPQVVAEPTPIPEPIPVPEPISVPESAPVAEPASMPEPEPEVVLQAEPKPVPESKVQPQAARTLFAEEPQQQAPAAKSPQRSLNDLFNEQKQDLGEKFQQSKIIDLTKAMSINDKFLFIRELFKNKSEEFSRAIQTLNKCENIEEAFDIMEGLKKQYFWDSTSSAYLALCDLVRRKF